MMLNRPISVELIFISTDPVQLVQMQTMKLTKTFSKIRAYKQVRKYTNSLKIHDFSLSYKLYQFHNKANTT